MGIDVIRDVQQIVQNKNDFSIDLIMKDKDGSNQIELCGLNTKHHQAYDQDGVSVNAKIASVAISEKTLIENSYVYRGTNNEVNLLNKLIDVVDSSGVVKNYEVREQYPDEALGLIVLILGDYGA